MLATWKNGRDCFMWLGGSLASTSQQIEGSTTLLSLTYSTFQRRKKVGRLRELSGVMSQDAPAWSIRTLTQCGMTFHGRLQDHNWDILHRRGERTICLQARSKGFPGQETTHVAPGKEGNRFYFVLMFYYAMEGAAALRSPKPSPSRKYICSL